MSEAIKPKEAGLHDKSCIDIGEVYSPPRINLEAKRHGLKEGWSLRDKSWSLEGTRWSVISQTEAIIPDSVSNC